MGTAVMWAIVIGLAGVVAGVVVLYRRGALTIDREKAKEAVKDIAQDTARDISKFTKRD